MKIAVLGLSDFPQGKKNLIDKRLKTLEGLIKPSKVTYITVELLGPGGLKEADGIICEKGSKLDIVIGDLEAAESRIERLQEGEDPKIFLRAKEILEDGRCLCEENFEAEERKTLVNSNFVSIRPVCFIDKNENIPAQEVIFDSYYSFGMICFFTGAKDKELRSWPIKKGVVAHEAAGAIHSDIQRGFIKAEVTGYEDIVKAGGLSQAKQFMHLEGKEYIVRDGDMFNFRFNV